MFEVLEGVRLAALVPNVRGIILSAAVRGDHRHDVAAMLRIIVDNVDDLDQRRGWATPGPTGWVTPGVLDHTGTGDASPVTCSSMPG